MSYPTTILIQRTLIHNFSCFFFGAFLAQFGPHTHNKYSRNSLFYAVLCLVVLFYLFCLNPFKTTCSLHQWRVCFLPVINWVFSVRIPDLRAPMLPWPISPLSYHQSQTSFCKFTLTQCYLSRMRGTRNYK